MKKLFFALFVLLIGSGLLVACGGSGGSSSSDDGTEKINGIVVPPDPGEVGKETLAGVDSNDNGIRDDVERKIAKDYGDNAELFSAVTSHAKKIQKLFETVDISQQSKGVSEKELKRSQIEEYKHNILCSSDSELVELNKVSKQYINTKERTAQYSEMLQGGIVWGADDCE